MRDQFKKKELPQDRIELLESIGMVWDPRESRWNEMYETLKDYKKGEDRMFPNLMRVPLLHILSSIEHGHVNVTKVSNGYGMTTQYHCIMIHLKNSQDTKDTKYKDLPRFVSTQRRFYTENRMRAERIKVCITYITDVLVAQNIS